MEPQPCRGARLLGPTPREPLRLRLRLTRGGRVYATITRRLRGGHTVALRGPLEWLENPPAMAEIAALLCCARSEASEWLIGALGSTLIGLLVALSFAPGSLGAIGLAILAALLGLVEVLASRIRSVRERGFADCVSKALKAGLPSPSVHIAASTIERVLKASRECMERGLPCAARTATPLGLYEVRVSGRAGLPRAPEGGCRLAPG